MSKDDFFFKLHVVLMLLVCFSGWLSVYFVKELWGYADHQLRAPIEISVWLALLYLCILLFFYKLFTKLQTKSLKLSFNLSNGSRVILLALFFVAALLQLSFSIRNFGYNVIGQTTTMPGATIIAFILTWVPSIFILEKRRIGDVLGLLAVLVFAVSLVRFNIVILALLYLAANYKNIEFRFILKTVLPICFVVIAISMFRVEANNELSEYEYSWVGVVASNLGAEWRDGIFGEIRLPKEEFSEIRKYHLQSLIRPAIPFINYIPGMNPGELIEKQIYHLYVTEAGLDRLGFTGIRVGMIWEMYYLYGYFGVVLLAILNSYFLSCFSFLRQGDSLNFGRIMLTIASIYGLVGQTSMFFGVFFQYGIYTIGAIFVLKILAKISAATARSSGK